MEKMNIVTDVYDAYNYIIHRGCIHNYISQVYNDIIESPTLQ